MIHTLIVFMGEGRGKVKLIGVQVFSNKPSINEVSREGVSINGE